MVTRYKIFMGQEQDFYALEDLKREYNDTNPGDWEYPTIMAFREGKLIGALGRDPRYNQIVIGPVYAPNVFIYKKLIECAEMLLVAAGVTQYSFYVRKDNHKVLEFISRLDDGLGVLRKRDENQDAVWFVRDI